MRKRLFLALAVGAAALHGCTLLVDLSGLAGDAGVDAGDASPDRNVVDASDASAAPDALPLDAAKDPCVGATFCDTFDTLPFGATWTESEIVGGATLTLTDGGLSAPFGARLFMPARTGTTSRVAELRTKLSPGSQVSCTVDLRIDENPAIGDTAVMTIRATNATVTQGDMFVTLTQGASLFYESFIFADGGSSKVNRALPMLPVGTWSQLTLKTDYTTVTVIINGVVAASKPLVVSQKPTSLVVGLGERGDSELGQTSVLFDNYRCVVTP